MSIPEAPYGTMVGLTISQSVIYFKHADNQYNLINIISTYLRPYTPQYTKMKRYMSCNIDKMYIRLNLDFYDNLFSTIHD